MSDHHRRVQVLSAPQIEAIAGNLRESFGLRPSDRVQMLPILEEVLPDLLKDYRFEIVPNRSMIGMEGQTDLSKPVIRFPDRTYEALRASDRRARFTAAHELGHLLLHSGANVHYARSSRPDVRSDPEWQANLFAAAFLMPAAAFRTMATPDEAMEKFGVSYLAVRHRARDLRHSFTAAARKADAMKKRSAKQKPRTP